MCLRICCGSPQIDGFSLHSLTSEIFVNCYEQYLPRVFIKQECIPVGCVPPAAVAIPGGLHQAPPGTRYPPGADPPDQATPQDQAPLGPGIPLGPGTPPGPGTPLGQGTPPLNRMTDMYKNITLRQTSFAGGNKILPPRINCLVEHD